MKTDNNIKKIGYSIFILLLLIIFTFNDLKISQYLYNKNSIFAKIFEITGQDPMFLAAIVCGFILHITGNKENKTVYNLSSITAIALMFFGYIFCIITVLHYIIYLNNIIYLIVFVVSLLLTILSLIYAEKLNKYKLMQFRKIAITGIYFILLTLLTVQLIKLFWVRVRFYDLDNTASNFTYWFLPQGINGNRSFPSGHVSSASIIYFLTLLSYYQHYKNTKIIFEIISFIFVLMVAISRVIIGAHYATDVLFGYLTAMLCFEISKKITKLNSM